MSPAFGCSPLHCLWLNSSSHRITFLKYKKCFYLTIGLRAGDFDGVIVDQGSNIKFFNLQQLDYSLSIFVR